MKIPLKITFINPNTEDEIVQAIARVLAYNLIEQDKNAIFNIQNLTKREN